MLLHGLMGGVLLQEAFSGCVCLAGFSGFVLKTLKTHRLYKAWTSLYGGKNIPFTCAHIRTHTHTHL